MFNYCKKYIGVKGGDNVRVNKSIGCIVNECKFHAKKESYCSLDHINVVKHHERATSKEATDCGSFEAER